ncbi:MAG: PAAR-like domain-containing protein [Enhygromyxa sp.]
MSGEVYANSREISGKATGNKSLGAMADVCMSPPSPPAGPIPIPYPNFSNAGDTDKGSKSVKVRGKPAGLKDKSNYKTSKGNEAATRNFGMGVVTHKIQGKTQYSSWSMDVKIEGYNVLRQLDMTTHNHGSPTFNLAITSDVAKFAPALPGDADCDTMAAREEEARKDAEGPPQAKLEKTTHSTGHYTAPDGKQYNMIACSKQVDFVKFPSYAEGVGASSVLTYTRTLKLFESSISPTDKPVSAWETVAAKDEGEPPRKRRKVERSYPAENDSNLCDGYQHKSRDNCSKSTHTEARMIEEIFKRLSPNKGPAGSLGTLRINVHWDQGGGRVSDKACSNCKELICAAEKCGLKVEMCQGDPPEPKPGCPASSNK